MSTEMILMISPYVGNYNILWNYIVINFGIVFYSYKIKITGENQNTMMEGKQICQIYSNSVFWQNTSVYLLRVYSFVVVSYMNQSLNILPFCVRTASERPTAPLCLHLVVLNGITPTKGITNATLAT